MTNRSFPIPRRRTSRPISPALVLVAALCAGTIGSPLVAQETGRPLDHEDYDRWERITDDALSPDGRWLVWTQVPGEGDPTVFVAATGGGARMTLPRGTDPVFVAGSRYVALTIEPAHAIVDSLRRAEVDRDELPPDTAAVIDLERVFGSGGELDLDRGVRRIGAMKRMRVTEHGGARMAVILQEDEDSDAEDAGQEEAAEDEDPDAEEESPAKGDPLVLIGLADDTRARFEHVTTFTFSGDGERLWYVADGEGDDADGVYRVDPTSGTAEAVATGEGTYAQMAVQEEGGRVAFLSDRASPDDDSPHMDLWVADAEGGARVLVGGRGGALDDGWWLADEGDVRLSKSGERVFFGTRPPVREADAEMEELLDDEKVRVDIWAWTDDRLQPMQKVRLGRDSARAYLAWAPFDGGDPVQLETPEVASVNVGTDGDAGLAVGTSDLRWRQLASWEAGYDDVYVVDVATGEARLLEEKVRWGSLLSPDEGWVLWFDGETGDWMARPVDGGPVRTLNAAIPHPVFDELNDRPDGFYPESYPQWTDDGRVVIYDAHDPWVVDPADPAGARSVTEGEGRRLGMRFRLVDPDPETPTIPADSDLHLTAFHLTNKQSGVWRDRIEGTRRPTEIVMDDVRYSTPQRADDADVYLYTKQTFRDYPDLYVADGDLEGERKLSDANPWQDEYRWGDARLVEWVSTDGDELQGILYTPDGFDPSQQYPMMVYFYERNSDGLHSYTVPSAGGSSINRSFYVSRGYLLFVPDIPYEIGHPGESALDAVVPGVQSLIGEGFVDPERIGVQGHSWGGYQIAWMLTRTNLFAAAEAGAPVVNMTSAYGGIRWGSGMSRMFQYERTQSRIGGTLWEKPLLYVENSPIFFMDKVQTPVMFMHNDEDTAVPWEQGIEYFVALRRLGKPAWMFNYNGEPHGLRRDANRLDFAIRMQQFFDHYLKDAPPPVWMVEGVPATLKGKSLGLDLVQDGDVPEPDEIPSRGGGAGGG
jgi:dipeptidyl aminopeptidase/acylaminoacyl peptidase